MPKGLHTEPYRRLRAQLVAERKQAGLTQAAVATRLSKPQSYVAKYERGERRLDVVELVELSAAIGFDPMRFVREFMAAGGSADGASSD
ncbi:MAG: transcriptional regulator [Rhodospirillaceae bacterium]|jgi:transcriptional regulator with XRE-family HTH domain|nr:transcriptional regulator [Rhodospirillaceae bacterium]|tara:strand:- start:283 stop:549 length:267 start_codon:yes stop_codon:yes gene_type:complete